MSRRFALLAFCAAALSLTAQAGDSTKLGAKSATDCVCGDGGCCPPGECCCVAKKAVVAKPKPACACPDACCDDVCVCGTTCCKADAAKAVATANVTKPVAASCCSKPKKVSGDTIRRILASI